MQLELSLWPPTSIRSVVDAYVARRCEDLAPGTLDDYRERAAWLYRELGEATPVETVTYARLERLVDSCRGVLRNVTVGKRINFLLWCMRYARKRDLIARVPECPPLRNDGEVRTGLHTVEQWQRFRGHLAPGRFRKLYDLAMWTGQHMPDVMSMQRWMLAPAREDYPGHAGSFWRRNRKFRRCVPGWMPMQPELRLLTAELLEDVGPTADSLIAGRAWNLKRTWDMAADRAAAAGEDIPRVTPTDLRRSCASLLSARGWSLQAVRIFLGHATTDGRIMGGRGELRPTVAERHYLGVTTGTFPAPAPTRP